MIKWFSTAIFMVTFSMYSAAQRQNVADTITISFNQISGPSGSDTNYLYMVPVGECYPGYLWYFERYFSKNLRAIYRGGTAMVVGAVNVWFVINKEGKCSASGYDSAAADPELAAEVLRVINKIGAYQIQTIKPSTIKGKPVVSRVKMRVVYQFAKDAIAPPPPPGPKPDILIVGYPPQY